MHALHVNTSLAALDVVSCACTEFGSCFLQSRGWVLPLRLSSVAVAAWAFTEHLHGMAGIRELKHMRHW